MNSPKSDVETHFVLRGRQVAAATGISLFALDKNNYPVHSAGQDISCPYGV